MLPQGKLLPFRPGVGNFGPTQYKWPVKSFGFQVLQAGLEIQ